MGSNLVQRPTEPSLAAMARALLWDSHQQANKMEEQKKKRGSLKEGWRAIQKKQNRDCGEGGEHHLGKGWRKMLR